ncbi:MAG: hypothetical protein RMM51_08065, partial [Verrucomicrobiae bacterium]|nr:hypothetical protein [Verrucomicrobiae bacterium]
MNLIHRARQIWVEQGPVGFWFRSLEKIGYRRVQLWRLDLTTLSVTFRVVRLPAEVDTAWLTANDHDAFLRWRTDVHPEDFQERLAL